MISEECVIGELAGFASKEREGRRQNFIAENTLSSQELLQPKEGLISEDRDLWLYRDRSIALLKRYVRLSIEIGRLPSLLGREFFRGRVTSYSFSTFEDTVIFVHDMEHSVEKLSSFQQAMIGKIVLEEYSQREAAKILNCPLRTVERFFPEALDCLSQILLAGGIMSPIAGQISGTAKSCQGGKLSEDHVSTCNNSK